MIFNSFAYFLIFLLPAAVAFRLAPAAWRPRVIAVSGAAFFVWFAPITAGGFFGAACLVIFLWEALFSRLYRPRAVWCWIGIVQAIAVLFVFKYWNFAVSLAGGAESGWHWPGAFLPLGVSFFTFEFIHYAEDRRRNRTEAGTVWEYLAFILFFPTMVAGPIKRYQSFLPSLRAPSTDWAGDFERGLTRILAGLAKKFCIADVMTSMTLHLNHADILAADRRVLPLWLLAYGIQIYIDFSAYSDIAIGSARLFGIRIDENFNWPYRARDAAEFWSRWHISLTRWLIDYVFIPLGGSRRGNTYVNVMVTMLVSGVWHGAGMNFVLWGLWHGAALCVHRAWTAFRERAGLSALPAPAGWALTFTTVTAGWAFFAMDVATARTFFWRLLFG